MREKKLYSLPEMTDEQGMKVAELEVEFGRDGWIYG